MDNSIFFCIFAARMVTLGAMQFTAVVLMMLLTLKLFLQRGKRKESTTVTWARQMMMAGTALLTVHFALQLVLQLRQMGITQSVELNLAMLIPASYLLAIAVLLLQRRGQLSRFDWLAGPVTWLVVMMLLIGTIATNGLPLLNDTPMLRQAETLGAVLYMLMQAYYTWRHSTNLTTMQHILSDYYDADASSMLRWMQTSIAGLMVLALMVPLAIFGSGTWLIIIAMSIYFFLFYLVDSFCYYLNSPAPAKIQEAEENADETLEKEQNIARVTQPLPLPSEIGEAISRWMAQGGYRKSGLLQPLAAADIGIPKYLLKEWLRQQNLKYSEWIAGLRVEEAKRIIQEHPDWSNDTVAQHCGFADRTVLQRTFKKVEGITPQQFCNQL